MSKSKQLSFYDKHNSTRTISGQFIKAVLMDEETNMVSVQFENDAVQEVGVAIADQARSVIGATIVSHQLVLQFDDESELVVGRIDPTTIRVIPALSGEGILIDPASATYKPIKSNDPAIDIVTTPTEVRFEVTLDPEQIVTPVTDGSLNPHLALVLKDVISSGTGLVGRAASAVGWTASTFNTVQAVNGVDASFSGNQLTLGRGTWYVDGLHTSNRAVNSKAAIKDDSGNIVLESLPKRQTTTDDSVMTLQINGYISVTGTTQTFTIEQYVSAVGTVGGLGATYLGGEFGTSRPVTEYNIYKVSDEPEVLDATFEVGPEPSILTALKNMAAQYGDRTPTPIKKFDEIRYIDNATWNFSGSCTIGNNVYFGPANNEDLVEWDTVTGKKTYYKAVPPTGTLFTQCLIPVESKIYIIPHAGVWIGIFDIVTKEVSWTNFGLTISTSTAKWPSGAYDPVTKKIVCSPNTTEGILVIDTVANTATIGTYGLTLLSSGNYFSTVLVGGKAYGIPMDATNILIYDFATNTAVQTNMGANLTGTAKWTGATYDPVTNKIVSTPYTATDALLIDIATQTATRTTFGLNLSGTAKFEFGGSTFGDGKVYMFPRQRANGQAICIDLVTDTGREITIPWIDGMNFVKSAVCNGKIHLMPIGNQNFAIYDPSTDGVTPEISGRAILQIGSTASYKFLNSGLAGDGTIYPAPGSLYGVYALNIERDFCINIPWPLDVPTTTNSYAAGIRDGEGNVHFVPYGNPEGMKVIAPHPTLGTKRKKHFKDHINLVPAMSSDIQDGYEVSASSFVAGYEPWKAFNRVVGSVNSITHVWSSAAADVKSTPTWIQMKFPAPVRVDVVRLRSGNASYPVTVAVLASEDGVTFVELARRKLNFRAAYTVGKDIELDEQLEFQYFRLLVLEATATNGTAINDIQFLQKNPSETDYYEVHAAQNSVSNSVSTNLLTITSSSNSHATNYSRHYLLRDWQYGVLETTSSWISADSSAEQWVEFRSLMPIKANAVRIVNTWQYFTQSIRVEASKNGKDYVVLLPNTNVVNPINGLSPEAQFRPIPVVPFANTEEYYSYRLVFVTRAITSGTQRNAGALIVKFLSTEEYDAKNYFGRAEQVFGVYGQSAIEKFGHGIYAPENGKIYYGKGDHANVVMGVYDTVNDEFYTTRFRENLSVAATERLISVRKNPWDDTYIFSASQTSAKTIRMSIGQNGEENLEFIPIAKDFIVGTGDIGESVMGPDGFCYSIPRSNPAAINVFDAKYLSHFTEFYTGGIAGTAAFNGGGLGPNGKIYFTPRTGNTFIELDPATMVTRTFTHIASSTAPWQNKAKLTKSGKMYLESLTGGAGFNGFYYLDFGPGIEIPDEILFSPYINN